MDLFQNDIFVEELIVRKNNILNILICLGIVLVAAVIVIAIFLFIPSILPAMLAIAVYGCYIAFKFQGVEFEYAFTNGDFDVDKIMAKRKRKRLVEISYKQIQVMAPYTAEFESETKEYKVSRVCDASASKNAAGRWFLIYEQEDGSFCFLVFQPSKRLREAMQHYLHSKIKGMA